MFFCVLHAEENSLCCKSQACGSNARAYSITVGHTEGSGIGYNQGYTSIDAYLAPLKYNKEWSPYVDLSGHIFNNGRWAANAGLGIRYLNSIAWGGNVYYDYRKTNHSHYNQIGVGLEAIGSFWSVHINGYLPFGKKKSPFFDSNINEIIGNAEFAYFQGNQIFLQLPETEKLTAKKRIRL